MKSGNIIFTRGVVAVRGICCDRLYGRRVTGQRNLYDKVLLQNTRDKIDKLHKAGVRNKPAKIKKMHRNREKWLDNWTFRVYTTLVSHNGLMRLKEECAGVG